MAQTSTYVKDPTTGAFNSQGAAGMVPVDKNASNPYTIFNNNIASILTQIQKGASAGRANLGGAINTLTNESVGAAGAYDPSATPGVNVQNQQGTMGAFAPALTSLNTQLSNANADIQGLTAAIPGIEAATLPTAVAGGSSLMTPSGQNLGTAPVYNSAINPLTLQPYGWTSAPSGSGGGAGSGVATSTGNVDLSTYSTNPNYTSIMQKQYQATSTDLKSLSTQIGGAPADAMTQYIKNNAPKSQITGSMIISTASQYGIDPAFLASQMLLETDFGTAGEAPANNNPGGVKFANQPGATRGTPAPDGGDYAHFASWSQGVAAQAVEIAKRQSAASSSSSANGAGVFDIKSDAAGLANGTIAPQVLQDRYTKAGVPALYLQAVSMAKQINPTFNETQANLKFQGQQTMTENVNSGNPITSIFSNLKNDLSTPSTWGILSPSKPTSGQTSTGMGYTILP